ncbi:hypothetical protein [Actinopolymorpha pittospori]|uniref:Uncharacterized protein n=1 Tax=Actinopolymorpha pittospori TaxID=648752 RepID=A0A927RJQ5_9ACTN|nr:hypothetical protein [Actinopolymorpha pittospori]MBE1605898.1 hypothetical protein [Actinopolymorpha pittospori]
MHEPEVVRLLGVQWPVLDHRSARARLERLGWAMCGEGDWAYAYRSPSGRLLARVGPFEPAYGYFVELCRRCAANRYVPQVELATQLEGGGHLAVLEHLSPPGRELVETFLRHWAHAEEADADLRALRHEVDRMDEWGRQNVRWWGGVDIGERHVLLSTDGNPKLIDLFFLAGRDLIRDLLDDPRAFLRDVPPHQRRYILDTPHFDADDRRRIRAALAGVASGQ